MPPKKVGAWVCSPACPSEPAASVTFQPSSARTRLSARATCAEPPRGKKNNPETTRRPPSRRAEPSRRWSRPPLPTPFQPRSSRPAPITPITAHCAGDSAQEQRQRGGGSPHAHPPRCPLRRPILVRRLPHILRGGRQRYGLVRSRTVSFFTSTASTASKGRVRLCRSSPRRTTISSGPARETSTAECGRCGVLRWFCGSRTVKQRQNSTTQAADSGS